MKETIIREKEENILKKEEEKIIIKEEERFENIKIKKEKIYKKYKRRKIIKKDEEEKEGRIFLNFDDDTLRNIDEKMKNIGEHMLKEEKDVFKEISFEEKPQILHADIVNEKRLEKEKEAKKRKKI